MRPLGRACQGSDRMKKLSRKRDERCLRLSRHT
jgi:hypothetical protein